VIRIFVTIALVFWSGAAVALSCIPSSIAGTYKAAADSPDRYMIVVGTLKFDDRKLPRADHSAGGNTKLDNPVPASLKGLSLTRSGFTQPYDAPITLNAQCFASWCASAASGVEYLAFVNLDKPKPEVTINPCGGFAFANPTPEMEKEVIRCRNGGRCVPKLRR
jgi:hypothetical protein